MRNSVTCPILRHMPSYTNDQQLHHQCHLMTCRIQVCWLISWHEYVQKFYEVYGRHIHFRYPPSTPPHTYTQSWYIDYPEAMKFHNVAIIFWFRTSYWQYELLKALISDEWWVVECDFGLSSPHNFHELMFASLRATLHWARAVTLKLWGPLELTKKPYHGQLKLKKNCCHMPSIVV